MKVRYLSLFILVSACARNDDDSNSLETYLTDGDASASTSASAGSEGMTEPDMADDTSGSVTDTCSVEDNCKSCAGWLNNCTTGLNFPGCIAGNVCCGQESLDRIAVQVCVCINCGEQCPRICASDGGSGYTSVGCNECLNSSCAMQISTCRT